MKKLVESGSKLALCTQCAGLSFFLLLGASAAFSQDDSDSQGESEESIELVLIPEPSSLSLLGLFGLVIGSVLRKRF